MMNRPGLYIAATVRNVAPHVPKLEHLFDGLRTHFDICGAFIVESDSEDSTVELFENLANRHSFLKFTSCGRLRDRIPDRIQRIAHCRSLVHNQVLESALAEGGTASRYVLVVDLDGVMSAQFLRSAGLRLYSAIHQLRDRNWYGLSGITVPFYYDVLALRCDGWVEEDFRNTLGRLTQAGFSDRLSKRIAIGSKQISIRKNEPPFQVRSAFNGLALYQLDAFKLGTYSQSGSSGDVCEHVIFNLTVQSASPDSSMYVVPELVVGICPAEHLLRADWSALLYGLKHRLFKSWM